MESNTEKQVKSKQRVADYGEVFTAEREVNAMLDLVKQETERIDSRFLEPACGSGNFLVEILKRKLAVVENRYKNHPPEWERYAVLAVSSIYGIDILEDNVKECRERLYQVFAQTYQSLYKENCNETCSQSVKFLLNRNIIWGDALDYTNPETKEPVVFSEWSAVNGEYLKRRDYQFKFLVEKEHQFALFNDEGEVATIDRPIMDYPLVHYKNLDYDLL
jgi:hypothetical protein